MNFVGVVVLPLFIYFLGTIVLPLFCCHKEYNIVTKKITEIAGHTHVQIISRCIYTLFLTHCVVEDAINDNACVVLAKTILCCQKLITPPTRFLAKQTLH